MEPLLPYTTLVRSSSDRADKVQFTPVERADAEAEGVCANLVETYRWRDAAAEACGLCVSDFKRSLRIFRIIVEPNRSEEHTSELQSLMRISYAVFCLKKKTTTQPYKNKKTKTTNITNI